MEFEALFSKDDFSVFSIAQIKQSVCVKPSGTGNFFYKNPIYNKIYSINYSELIKGLGS